MKYKIPSVLAATSLAIGLGMTSCVAPYDSYGTTTVTSYSPGHRINSLPGGYRTEIIGGSTYYYHNGSYYRSGSGGYVVADAPRSSRYYREYDRDRSRDQRYHGERRDNVNVLTRLPDGHRAVSVRGKKYYQHKDNYYRRQGNGYITGNRPF